MSLILLDQKWITSLLQQLLDQALPFLRGMTCKLKKVIWIAIALAIAIVIEIYILVSIVDDVGSPLGDTTGEIILTKTNDEENSQQIAETKKGRTKFESMTFWTAPFCDFYFSNLIFSFTSKVSPVPSGDPVIITLSITRNSFCG